MDDQEHEPKVERRDGKIFVEGEKYPYVQGMIRTLFLTASELYFGRSVSHSDLDGTVRNSSELVCKARLDKDALRVIGNKDEKTEELYLTFRPWVKDDPERANAEKNAEVLQALSKNAIGTPPPRKYTNWSGVLFFSPGDVEIDPRSTWGAEVYLPPPLLEELVTACRRGSLATLSLGFHTNLWVHEYDWHTPPRLNVTWYVYPEHWGPNLTLTVFRWTEKPLPLGDEQEQVDSPAEQDKAAHAADTLEPAQPTVGERQLAIAERVRKALYVIAGALVLLVFFLMLK
jgi:hypothetical protein